MGGVNPNFLVGQTQIFQKNLPQIWKMSKHFWKKNSLDKKYQTWGLEALKKIFTLLAKLGGGVNP